MELTQPAPRTVGDLAAALGMHPDTVRKNRLAVDADLTAERAAELLRPRLRASGARREEKAEKARAFWADLVEGREPSANGEPSAESKTDSKTDSETATDSKNDSKAATNRPAIRSGFESAAVGLESVGVSVESVGPPKRPAIQNESAILAPIQSGFESAATDSKAESKNDSKRPAIQNGFESVGVSVESVGGVSGWIRSREAVTFVMIVGLIAQMAHTVGFFLENNGGQTGLGAWAVAVGFALAVDLTALVLTVHRGQFGYLVGFAAVHFFVNLTYHFQTGGDGLNVWAAVVLSAVLAFSNFSYSHLFADDAPSRSA